VLADLVGAVEAEKLVSDGDQAGVAAAPGGGASRIRWRLDGDRPCVSASVRR